jgi:uncharacterized RDD family membrane protein YckC
MRKNKPSLPLYHKRKYLYFIFASPIIYNVIWLKTKKRATIGQQLLNLMVIKRDGKNISFNEALNRVCSFMICKVIFLAPFTVIIPVFLTKEKNTLYDFLTSTRVIEITK